MYANMSEIAFINDKEKFAPSTSGQCLRLVLSIQPYTTRPFVNNDENFE